MRARVLVLMTALAALPASRTTQASTPYTVTDLGIAGETSYANRINEYGQVVGTCSSGTFLWTPVAANRGAGSRLILGSGTDGLPSINDFGQVAFNSPDALLWTPSTPNGTSGSAVFLWTGGVYGVNNSGACTGFDITGGTHGVLWQPSIPNGPAGELHGLSGLWSARGINNNGQVAGMTADHHTLLWQPDSWGGTTGTTYDLGDLPGNRAMSYPVGMNDRGQVVGCSSSSLSDEAEAFLWTPDIPNGVAGQMIPLGIPQGCSASQAQDVNTLGQIVGFGWYNEKAFLWSQQDGMVDLNSLIQPSGLGTWHLVDAWGINDYGQIVGNGNYDSDGQGPLPSERHAFLLTPVPEPATLSSLALGGLAMIRRRRTACWA